MVFPPPPSQPSLVVIADSSVSLSLGVPWGSKVSILSPSGGCLPCPLLPSEQSKLGEWLCVRGLISRCVLSFPHFLSYLILPVSTVEDARVSSLTTPPSSRVGWRESNRLVHYIKKVLQRATIGILCSTSASGRFVASQMDFPTHGHTFPLFCLDYIHPLVV